MADLVAGGATFLGGCEMAEGPLFALEGAVVLLRVTGRLGSGYRGPAKAGGMAEGRRREGRSGAGGLTEAHPVVGGLELDRAGALSMGGGAAKRLAVDGVA